MTIRQKVLTGVPASAAPPKHKFEISASPEEGELSKGIQVNLSFRDEFHLGQQLMEKFRFSSSAASTFISGAKTPSDVEANIAVLFMEARQALGEGGKLGAIIDSLNVAKKYGFISGRAGRELAELCIARFNEGYCEEGWDLRNFGFQFKDLEPYIRNDHRLQSAVEHMAVMALHNTAEKCRNKTVWSYVGNEDIDYSLNIFGKGMEYLPQDWDDIVAKVRQETYSAVLEKEKARLAEWAIERDVHLVFVTFFEGITYSHDYFDNVDRLAEKLGKKGAPEIEAYKDEVRKSAAKAAFDFHANHVRDHINVLVTGDDSKSSIRGPNPVDRAIWAAKDFEHVKKAFAYVPKSSKEEYRSQLAQMEASLAPFVLAAIEAKRSFIETGAVKDFSKFIAKFQCWVDREPVFQERVSALLEAAKQGAESLRTRYASSRDPTLLADMILGLPVVREFSTDVETQEPYLVSFAMMGCMNCPGCGTHVNSGFFTINNPKTSEVLKLGYVDLHALQAHPEAKTELADKIRDIEKILCL